MEESILIPKNLTYASAQNLQDLEKLEKMEELENLNQEMDYLVSQLRDVKRMLKKEQQIRIYNDIEDDDMYKRLNTEKSQSEDELNQSFDNSSLILENVKDIGKDFLSEGLMANSTLIKRSHTIRNKSRSDFLKPPSRSMIFDEEPVTEKPFGRKKSENIQLTRITESTVLSRNKLVNTKGVRSLRNYLVRGMKQNILMNSGISPQVRVFFILI